MTGDTDNDCPVCLAPLARDNRWRSLHCEHWLHRECWDAIARTSPKLCCPMCRQKASSIICAHSREVHAYAKRSARLTLGDERIIRKVVASIVDFMITLVVLMHFVIGWLLMRLLAHVPVIARSYAILQSIFVRMLIHDVCDTDSFLGEVLGNVFTVVVCFALGFSYTTASVAIVRRML